MDTKLILLFVTLLLFLGFFAGQVRGLDQRQKARKAYDQGNYKDAYEAYRTLILDPPTDSTQIGEDLKTATECLKTLTRVSELDALWEGAVQAHESDWRLLFTVASSYFNAPHYGFIVAGEFQRGQHRGGGRRVNAHARDRLRALQLMTQAMEEAKDEKSPRARSDFYLEFAEVVKSDRTWHLQYLSDLSVLPDYDESDQFSYGEHRGAPVHADGKPVFYKVPESYRAAQNDGERWRWLLTQAMEVDPDRINETRYRFAEFLRGQFGVGTTVNKRRSEPGISPATLKMLSEEETIARLATGVHRFELPDEFNFVKNYREIAENPQTGYGEQALGALAEIFTNRYQFSKVADYWKQSIEAYGDDKDKRKQRTLDQIVGNWGRFEATMTHPAGRGATVAYSFRNGHRVCFKAHEIHIKKLLGDVKAYIKSKPKRLDSNRINIQNIGYRLVKRAEKRYIGPRAAAWELDIEPREGHLDKTTTVATPLQKAGAYLLTAEMADGNTSRIIIWINDTVIAKKPVDQGTYYFVADAITGRPIAKANLEFFGYEQRRKKNRTFDINTTQFAEFTDSDGQVIPAPKDLRENYQWLITATTADGRFAYLGFSGVWHRQYDEMEYNQAKGFVITDRPVYRPDQTVKFKFWVRHAKYDQEDTSRFANQSFTAQIDNPKGEKIFEKEFTADDYGGFDGEFPLAPDAALGQYRIFLQGNRKRGRQISSGGYFRVEEYKKPEFEVTVSAPTEAVPLGERITATITAAYYFGAPVTQATVKYKVLRSNYGADWYPVRPWDWLYGRGYWWYASDYDWYPGWAEWGHRRPIASWGTIHRDPPEVVLEDEVEIGPDGTVKVEIDTAIAKEMHGDTDHRYEISAEVRDESRRTIVGQGQVLVARKPFQVYAWVDRGYYSVGDTIHAHFFAQTLDNKPVTGKGSLDLLKITYNKENQPVETAVQKWDLDTDDQGGTSLQMKASEAGQYRLSYKVTDTRDRTIEGGYLFTVRGEGFDGAAFRFSDIELIPDRTEYQPGDPVKLMINTNRFGSTVALFVRPANGLYLPPKILRMEEKSVIEEIAVVKEDMPNFFVEAFTISAGKLHSEVREIVVPPAERVLNVEVVPSSDAFKPGENANVKIKLTDQHEEPFAGTATLTVYDKALEYISGGSNVPEIRFFFWAWRRSHRPFTESSFDRRFGNLLRASEIGMSDLVTRHIRMVFTAHGKMSAGGVAEGDALLARQSSISTSAVAADETSVEQDSAEIIEPTVRTEFADTALWVATLVTAADGTVEIDLTMPENLTGWRIKTWVMGHGTKVGEGESEVVTTKDLLLRMQAPRFFVETDEVVLSANVHNYLDTVKSVTVQLELDGGTIEPMGDLIQRVKVDADGEERVDWRVKVVAEGESIVCMKALTDEESDAMEMRFPVYVHGMMKQVSFSGSMRPDEATTEITINVPEDRRPDESRLEIRYSPTLAGAMVDALPYLVDYPYGCTEQTLSRFLPTVITQKILLDMNLDLKAIQEKHTNLNAQEIGENQERAKGWGRSSGGGPQYQRNPVFDEETVRDMVKQGLKELTAMQLADGGWGWFSGWGERSYPHTTAYVVHGLQIARENEVAIVPGVLERGTEWLKNYQAEQVRRLKNAETEKRNFSRPDWKRHADNIDAFVYMVLADADILDNEMRDFLYRDRNQLSVYAKAMFGLALYQQKQAERLEMILHNIEQYLVKDEENQTAYLNLPNSGYWWYWYGSESEAHAYYLKLLARTDPTSEKASGLVKYLLNNRKHGTYWNSTRDTAICIEAMADYLQASGEDQPDLTVEIFVDGAKRKAVEIGANNLFDFDNAFVLLGDALKSGKHTIEFKKTGSGPLYFNAYLAYFSLEDFIAKAGLEVRVSRKYYRLSEVDKSVKVAGGRGQPINQRVEKYEREELTNLSSLRSGDLVEVELEIDSKNDYEYLVFEDAKAAGFEPAEVRSGYNGNDLGAYMELRDDRVSFFVRRLARGQHSVSYRMRAEIPGRFSALPTRGYAMYAPELRGNSDEIKLSIED